MARSGWRLAAPAVLAVSGMMFAVSAQASGGDDLRAGRYTELTDLVRSQERRAAELTDRLESLQREVETLSAAEGDTSPVARDRLDELRPAAGLTAVEGPGVTVALDDAPLPAEGTGLPEGTTYDDYVVHQQDVEGVVNALWAGGAEAMTIMDQRIVGTSAVRCVGNVLILHGRVYSPPFTISAVGDVDGMTGALEESAAVAAYRSWADYIGLGYTVTTGELEMPAYDGPLAVTAEAE